MSESTPAEKPYIVCAALKSKESSVIICGPRHSHCFEELARRTGVHMYDLSGEQALEWEQGFVDQFCRFYSRSDAHRMARITGQLPKLKPGGALMSEDLY